MKRYAGNFPPGDGWTHAATVEDEGMEWHVLVKRQEHSQDWITAKVFADGRAERKANYWSAKNIKTGQIGYTRDMASMREHRPNLHRLVEQVFAKVAEKWG